MIFGVGPNQPLIQDGGSKTLLCLKKPLQPSTLIPGKFQQKFSLMAPMSNVPYITRQIVSVSPCQIYDLLETQFLVKKCGSKTEIPIIYRPFFYNIKPLPWSDPDFPRFDVHERDNRLGKPPGFYQSGLIPWLDI